jgi:hypothetical protein
VATFQAGGIKNPGFDSWIGLRLKVEQACKQGEAENYFFHVKNG